jgi:hypothetical protein
MPRLSTVESWSYESRNRNANWPQATSHDENSKNKNWSTSVTLRLGSFLKTRFFIPAFLFFVIGLVCTSSAQTLVPAVVSTRGYINRTPLTSHVTAIFNTLGSTTMVAYVSSHPSWNGRPVSLIGLSDNVGNTWKVLEGPTTGVGSTVPLLSAIYYVNAPVTTDAYIVTVNLTNPAPLVVHVIGVSGSDITAPPQHSAINSLSVGGRSTDVSTETITVPDHTLLLAWTKNESIATARVLDGYTLDRESTGFLWGGYKPVFLAGSYASHFQYDSAIGHQTAIVAIRAAVNPVASSQAVTTRRQTAVNIILSALSPKGHPLMYSLVSGPTHGCVSGTFPSLTYTPDADYVGDDSLSFKAYDGSGESNSASFRIAVQPKTLIQLFQENSTKLGYFSILVIATVGARLRLKRYAVPRSFQMQAD